MKQFYPKFFSSLLMEFTELTKAITSLSDIKAGRVSQLCLKTTDDRVSHTTETSRFHNTRILLSVIDHQAEVEVGFLKKLGV